SGTTLSILAASFGLAQALNDAYYSTFLFSEAPGLLSKKVKDLQDAYVKDIADAQKTPAKRTIKTAGDAYNAIRNYYHICLRDAIEGVLLEAVAKANGEAQQPGGNGGNPQPNLRAANAPERDGTNPTPARSTTLRLAPR